MRLGKYIRDEKSVRDEGENLRAVWSPDSKLIALLVSPVDPKCSIIVYTENTFLLDSICRD